MALSEQVLEALGSAAVVVSANDRLAREIRQQYALHQASNGLQAWESGKVLSWNDWLRALGEQVLWSGYASPSGRRQLLTGYQEQILWERVVTESKDPPLNIRGTAGLARDAWQLLQEWRLPDPGTVGFTTAEQSAFSRWMKTYHRHCADNAWLDSARVIDSLVPAISSGAVPVPPRVLLTGFDSFNPQQRGLLRVLAGMGTRLAMTRGSETPRQAGLLTLAKHDEELETAVRWLRGLVLAGGAQRVGMVVPGLRDNFQRVERVLDSAFMAGASLPGASSEAQRPYEVVAGRPLRKQPVVVAADHVLALSMGGVSMRVLSRIIRSPFISGGVAEAPRRARFDAWIREKGSVDVDVMHLPGMLEAFRHATGIAATDFRLESLVMRMLDRKDINKPRMPGQWATGFRELLEIFGWPGEGRQDAIQQQAQHDFEKLVDEFASLDRVLKTLTAPEALRVFRHLLRQRQFQFHAPNTPIMVLEPADAEWLSFDHLWICDAASGRWRSDIGQPNPFIPVEWQRNHELPESDPGLRDARTTKRIGRLVSAAPSVVVSRVETSTGALPSAFATLPSVSQNDIELAELTDYRRALLATTDIQVVTDDRGPALDPVESIDLDQAVVELQAACPFRSFAVQRLGARPLRALRPGLRPEARVELVRMGLEHMWHRIESSDVLQAALSGEHLEVQIWEVADTVLAVFERKLPVRLSRRYRALEHARMVRLLMQWLRVETRRAPFQVQQTNVFATIEIAGVTIRAHVDRIDSVSGQGMAVIDYDTAPFVAEKWTGERPDSPTLQLYVLATEEEPVALLTGFVSAERMDLSGVQHTPVVTGLPVYEESRLATLTGLDWDGLLESWRHTLTRLTGDFAGGNAAVDPKHGAETCSACHLASLCRVNEMPVEPST